MRWSIRSIPFLAVVLALPTVTAAAVNIKYKGKIYCCQICEADSPSSNIYRQCEEGPCNVGLTDPGHSGEVREYRDIESTMRNGERVFVARGKPRILGHGAVAFPPDPRARSERAAAPDPRDAAPAQGLPEAALRCFEAARGREGFLNCCRRIGDPGRSRACRALFAPGGRGRGR